MLPETNLAILVFIFPHWVIWTWSSSLLLRVGSYDLWFLDLRCCLLVYIWLQEWTPFLFLSTLFFVLLTLACLSFNSTFPGLLDTYTLIQKECKLSWSMACELSIEVTWDTMVFLWIDPIKMNLLLNIGRHSISTILLIHIRIFTCHLIDLIDELRSTILPLPLCKHLTWGFELVSNIFDCAGVSNCCFKEIFLLSVDQHFD